MTALSERDFMDQVTQLAEIRGWSWAHFRPAQTSKGWRTPVSGPLGKGWPDLFMVRAKDGRMMAAELKRDGAKQTFEQAMVEDALVSAGISTYVWHPSDWPEIEEVLR